MMIRSAPPSSRPRACSAKTSTSRRNEMSPRVGSSDAGQEAGRADRAGDEAALAHRLAGDLGRLAVDLERVLAETPLVELQPRRLEACRSRRPRRRPRPSRRGRPRSRRGGSGPAPRGTCPGARRSPRTSGRTAPGSRPCRRRTRRRAHATAPRKSRSVSANPLATSIAPGCRTVPGSGEPRRLRRLRRTGSLSRSRWLRVRGYGTATLYLRASHDLREVWTDAEGIWRGSRGRAHRRPRSRGAQRRGVGPDELRAL